MANGYLSQDYYCLGLYAPSVYDYENALILNTMI